MSSRNQIGKTRKRHKTSQQVRKSKFDTQESLQRTKVEYFTKLQYLYSDGSDVRET